MTAPVARLDIHTRQTQRIAAMSIPEFTVVQVRAGTKRVSDDRRELDVEAGAFLAVAPGELLNIHNLPPKESPYSAVCLSITRELVREAGVTPGQGQSRWDVLAANASLDQAFTHAEQGLEESLNETLLRHRVLELVSAVVLGGFQPQLAQTPGIQERLRVLLAADPPHAWRASEAADRLAVSTATLRRKLSDEGSSFRATLLEVRLVHAMALIQGTDKSLQRVAEESGYMSSSHFSRHFRTRYGCTPSSLRD